MTSIDTIEITHTGGLNTALFITLEVCGDRFTRRLYQTETHYLLTRDSHPTEKFKESDESFLERQIKKLEREMRKHPNRSDLKLQAIEMRRQLKALKAK
jgi:hypothetical protein